MRPVVIDASMMGQYWDPPKDDILKFAGILARLSGREIVVASAHNAGGPDEISDAIWLRALADYIIGNTSEAID